MPMGCSSANQVGIAVRNRSTLRSHDEFGRELVREFGVQCRFYHLSSFDMLYLLFRNDKRRASDGSVVIAGGF